MKTANGDLSTWDNFVIWIKSKLYTILSIENIDKLTKRKEDELESLEVIKKEMHKDIKKELDEEFGDYYSDKELDEMFKEIINE